MATQTSYGVWLLLALIIILCQIFNAAVAQSCTVGFPSTVSSCASGCNDGANQRVARIIPDMNFTCTGTVTHWRAAGFFTPQGQRNADAVLSIWKEISNNPGTYERMGRIQLGTCGGQLLLESPSTNNIYECTLPQNETVSVQPGDVIGIEIPENGDYRFQLYFTTGGGPTNYQFSGHDSPATLSQADSTVQDQPQISLTVEPIIITTGPALPTTQRPTTTETSTTDLPTTDPLTTSSTTGSPTTQSPTTTKAPTTELPMTTQSPTTTEAPTTELPMTTQSPTTTKAPMTELPTTTQSPTTTEAPTTELPMTTQSPTTTEAPMTELPTTKQSPTTTEAPTTELPMTTQSPTTTEAPMTELPTTKQSPTTTEAPTTELPMTTQSPTTTEAPTTELPTTRQSPTTTEAPTTELPTTRQSPTTTEAPTTELPTTTQSPTTQTEASSTDVTTTEVASTQPPTTTRAPTTTEAATTESITGSTVIESPTTTTTDSSTTIDNLTQPTTTESTTVSETTAESGISTEVPSMLADEQNPISTETIAGAAVGGIIAILLVLIIVLLLVLVLRRQRRNVRKFTPAGYNATFMNLVYDENFGTQKPNADAGIAGVYSKVDAADLPTVDYDDIDDKKPTLPLSDVFINPINDYSRTPRPSEMGYYSPTQLLPKDFWPESSFTNGKVPAQGQYSECGEAFEEDDTYWEPASDANELYKQLSAKKYREIVRKQIQITGHLGSGQFGIVSKGIWQSPMGAMDVAVKQLQPGASEEEKIKFLQEAAINGQFRHPNVVKLMGVVTVGKPTMIVLELLSNGDLHNYLLKLQPSPGEILPSNTQQLLLKFCQQVASGMDYLARKAFVHRDLAARNILVADDKTCKISDFGMSRDLADENYYVSHGGKIPVKWTAPEAIHYKKYSTASDVWSYGCVMYEIWSLGHKPFETYRNPEVVQMVDKGYRLPPPPGLSKELYKIMIQCWHPDRSSRPTFPQLVEMLSRADFELFVWEEEDLKNSDPQVKMIGAPLEVAKDLYFELQRSYLSS